MERRKLNLRPDGTGNRIRDAGMPPPSAARMGRPPLYRPGFDTMVYKFRLMGLSKPEIADVFEVGATTIDEWLMEQPSFRAAWDAGGVSADAHLAARLYQKAMGYTRKAEKLWYDSKEGEVVRATYTEYYPPDVTAGVFLLTNRQPKRFKTSRNANEQTGADGEPLAPPSITINPVSAPSRSE